MEKSNVNNLNGVPNFGYGYEKGSLENPYTEAEAREIAEAEVEVVPTEEQQASVDEVEDEPNTKLNGKRTTKNRKDE